MPKPEEKPQLVEQRAISLQLKGRFTDGITITVRGDEIVRIDAITPLNAGDYIPKDGCLPLPTFDEFVDALIMYRNSLKK